jgi:hypothetical protein
VARSDAGPARLRPYGDQSVRRSGRPVKQPDGPEVLIARLESKSTSRARSYPAGHCAHDFSKLARYFGFIPFVGSASAALRRLDLAGLGVVRGAQLPLQPSGFFGSYGVPVTGANLIAAFRLYSTLICAGLRA